MEEKMILEAPAQYFKSATHMKEGHLSLTNRRVLYLGAQARVKFNHGALGNVIRDKMEEAMGYGNAEEECAFDIPLAEVQHRFKRFGLSKRFVIGDGKGNEYSLMLNVGKAVRDSWPAAIDDAKKAHS
jgi:hypothetical protein